MDNNDNIMVTIRCITFNHAKYIRQCLDSFLMQKTNFKFEILIHDDASTDGTTDIIKDYAQRYPDIVKPLYEEENQYSKYGNLMTVRRLMDQHLRGKYTALCEGDDYWTDPDKLQKQVDFLESHPEHSMVFHQTMRHYQDTDRADELYYDKLEERDYTGLEMYQQCRPAEASVVMRTSIHHCDVYKKFVESGISFGDLPVFLTCAHCGRVHALTDVMAVYRIHKSGVSNIFNSNNRMVLKFAEDNLKLYKIYGDQYKEECINIYVMDYVNFFLKARKNGEMLYDVLFHVLRQFPVKTLQCLTHRFKYSHFFG